MPQITIIVQFDSERETIYDVQHVEVGTLLQDHIHQFLVLQDAYYPPLIIHRKCSVNGTKQYVSLNQNKNHIVMSDEDILIHIEDMNNSNGTSHFTTEVIESNFETKPTTSKTPVSVIIPSFNLPMDSKEFKSVKSLDSLYKLIQHYINIKFDAMDKSISYEDHRLYDYCNTIVNKTALIIVTNPESFKEKYNELYVTAEKHIRRLLSNFLVMVRPDYSFNQDDMNDLLTHFVRFTGNRYFDDLKSSRTSFSSMLRKRKSRMFKVNGYVQNMIKKKRGMNYNEELLEYSTLLRQCSSKEEFETIMINSVEIRKAFIESNKHMGLDALIFVLEKFPIINANIFYLVEDYNLKMKSMGLDPLNIGEIFENYISLITTYASKHWGYIDTNATPDGKQFDAIKNLFNAIKLKRNLKKLDYTNLVVEGDVGEDQETILKSEKIKGISHPFIIMCKQHNENKYYIAIERNIIKINGELKNSLHWIYAIKTIFNIKFGTRVEPFFSFLERMAGIPKKHNDIRDAALLNVLNNPNIENDGMDFIQDQK